MALAYLTAGDAPPGSCELTADIGTNEFYEYRIGARGEDGQLARIDHVSPLRRREGGGAVDSRFTLRIPPSLLSRGSRDVQLCSYRDARRNGPACSRVVSVVPGLGRMGLDAPGGPHTMSATSSVAFRPCRQAAFSFEESAVSHAMFLDGLLAALRALAPAVIDAAPAIVGAATGGKGLDSDLLSRLLRAVADATKPAETKGEPAKPASLDATSRAQMVDGGVLTGPLLASLLGPLLQQAPQLLQVLTDKPLQFLTTLIAARQQAQLQKQQHQQDFIAGLLAEANRSMILREAMRRSAAAGAPAAPAASPDPGAAAAQALSLRGTARPSAPRAAARASDRFHLAFEPGTTVSVSGKPKSVYRPDQGITLLARVAVKGAVPRSPLPRAIVEVTLTDLDRGEPVLAKTFRLTDVAAGAPLPLAFTADELAKVPRHRDLHVAASIRWPSDGGRRIVTARGDHAIYLTGGHLLTAIGAATGAEIPLDDPATYRAFWHRVWEGPARLAGDGKRWELDVVCRYYLRASLEHDSNARIETRLALDTPPDPAAITYAMGGRMKSGLELSLDELNRLAPLVGGEPVSASELAALKSSEVRGHLDLEGTARVRLSGKKTNVGVVWVYPEVTLRDLSLAAVEATDEAGQVTRVIARQVRFPFPSSIHFVSLRSS